jgi:ABC-type sugar transport system ATPase subunit
MPGSAIERAEISRIQKELSIPAVYVTHDQAEALSMSDRVIVMDAGRIVEEGEPRTLYRRPASRFAADFIGAANFLSLVYRDQNWFAPDGSAVRLAQSEPGELEQAREAVLRSEILRIRSAEGPGPDEGLNALHGTVESFQYMGPHIEYVIDVSGVSLSALSGEEFVRGATVLVTFRPQDIHLLPLDRDRLAPATPSRTLGAGALSSGPNLALPNSTGARRSPSLHFTVQSDQTSHHVPVCFCAFCSHCSGSGPGFGPT